MPARVDQGWLAAGIAAQQLARDLINTPANDMGPEELAGAAADLAAQRARWRSSRHR
jgi:leucyl aminopeptidase